MTDPGRPGVGRRWDDRLVPSLVALAAGSAYAALAWIGWRDIATPSWDLGIFTQLARAYSELGAPIVDIKGHEFNLLGDHFHPLLVLLGPLYRLHPSGWTLLLAQVVLFALSAVPLTAVARERLGRTWGTVVGVGYAFSSGLQGAVAAQFHEIAFAVPLLALSLAAFLRDKPLRAAAWAAPLVFVKEDLGLTVAALGAVLLWRAMPSSVPRSDAEIPVRHATSPDAEGPARHAASPDAGGPVRHAPSPDAEGPVRHATSPDVEGAARHAPSLDVEGTPGRTVAPAAASPDVAAAEVSTRLPDRLLAAVATRSGRTGLWLGVWGVTWVVLAVVVILPLLNPGGQYDYVDRIGSEHMDWFATAVTVLWPPVKIVTLLLLALGAGLVGVRSPLMWLVLPTLAWRFIGNVPYYWGWEWHYSAILMPVVTAALIDVVGRRPNLAESAVGTKPAPTTSRASRAPGRPGAVRDAHAPLRSDALRAVAAMTSIVATVVVWPTLPLVTTFAGGPPEPSPRIEAARGAVAAASATPPRSGDEPVVVSDIYLLAHLVPTTRAYWIGNDNPVPDAVVLDTWRRDSDDQDVEVVAERYFPGWDYQVVHDEQGYAVAALVGPQG